MVFLLILVVVVLSLLMIEMITLPNNMLGKYTESRTCEHYRILKDKVELAPNVIKWTHTCTFFPNKV